MAPAPDPKTSADGRYYERLELGPAASHEDIVRSYRRLALGVHPDAHPEDPEASRRFREITEAYEVLADPGRRRAYDRTSGASAIPVRFIASSVTEPRAPMGEGPSPNDEPIFLGTSRSGPTAAVPLRVGPVRIEAGSEDLGEAWASQADRSALSDLISDFLSSWWRR